MTYERKNNDMSNDNSNGDKQDTRNCANKYRNNIRITHTTQHVV